MAPSAGKLYSAEDLMRGFNPWDPMGFTLTHDFSIYRKFTADGGIAPLSLSVRLAQAEHDAKIGDALREFLKNVQRPIVGIMGGHGVSRDSVAYKDIAHLSRRLARENFLVVTGGGPGVMEAAHLGVAFSSFDDDQPLEAAIGMISAAPKAPTLDDLFEPDWTIRETKLPNILQARDWMKVAMEVRRTTPETLPISLAIPTWRYGAEPTSPFASHYAKYFQDSLREEALINSSRAGIVYGQGGGGTLREIFQDVELNFYATSLKEVTPMIFFDREDFWRTDAVIGDQGATKPGINVDPEITKVLLYGLVSPANRKETVESYLRDKIKFTTKHNEIIEVLKGHSKTSQHNLRLILNGKAHLIGR